MSDEETLKQLDLMEDNAYKVAERFVQESTSEALMDMLRPDALLQSLVELTHQVTVLRLRVAILEGREERLEHLANQIMEGVDIDDAEEVSGVGSEDGIEQSQVDDLTT